MSILTGTALGCALFQSVMIARNLGLYHPPAAASTAPPLSVLIPARDEAANLPGLLACLQEQKGLDFEVLVVDDDSSDETFAIAQEFAERDSRFHVFSAGPLPAGWAGKQHACHLLSERATHEGWVFLDADITLTDPYALARISAHLAAGAAAMQSAIPRQITGSWAEHMIVPLIHLVLLGYLPFWEMRRNLMPALGAACGQLVAVKASAYRAVGGHGAVRHRLHDATALAALLRKNGHQTDLFDATDLADCRMYRTASDVFSGFAKNATEGMARPRALPIWTFLLLGANVLPLLAWGSGGELAVYALICSFLAQLSLMHRFRQSLWSLLLRPLAVLVFVLIQWQALAAKWLGRPSEWKGRRYARIHE